MSLNAKDTEGFAPIDANALVAEAKTLTGGLGKITGTLLDRTSGEKLPGVEVRLRADDGISVWAIGEYDAGAVATESQPARTATGARGPWVFLKGPSYLQGSFEPTEKWLFRRDV